MEDYIEFDEYGLKEVRCMICNTPVAERTYIEMPDMHDPMKKVNVMTVRRNSNWRQPQKVEIEMDGNAYPKADLGTMALVKLFHGLQKRQQIIFEHESKKAIQDS